jgi:ABC-type dipeptide/oligopeptide/nickel transport system permease component
MREYIIQRLLQFIPTLLLASIAIFILMNMTGGDPARMMLGSEATEAMVQAERERLGLNKPLPVRYAIWLNDLLHFRLGYSMTMGRPVASLVFYAFRNTMRLTLIAFGAAILIGGALGILAALNQNGPFDSLITALSSVGFAIPSFWLGILMILLFSVRLRWLPPSGIGDAEKGLIGNLPYLVMPVISIGFGHTAVFSRFVRTSLIEVLGKDYIRTAHAKGLMKSLIIMRHALRNALIPVVTVLGMSFATMLGGAVITESVFAYPGMGRLVVNAVLNRDYPVVQAALMLVVLVFIVTNLIVDLSYAYLDPRIRFSVSNKLK